MPPFLFLCPMYRTAPQILFQFVGGLSITQYAYPVLYDAFTAEKSDPHAATVAMPSNSGSFSGLWGSVRWSFRAPPVDRALSDDVAELLRTHCWFASAVLLLTVVSGGAPSLLGSGLSVYCNGGPEGKARYSRLKQQLRNFSEKGNQV
ncbi:conserved hypothetical protein [Leishmania braziliensis MHOM/BR/75/M2904]|uniref:Uncharacterized protein n=2 Tax=Leishmania braziliensis TaxID=5660 RepID=A4H348_LEIBR|nr:conserved hypothetical protein [Leishmania braziliensis MHOM/BR/75/M2904]CAJ2465602.1 unnamed protein product [Leishmania braziliensis]CAM36455.1 conserved hypothetical protein [Leishmania braziliensis MHOM/BR/75/M2904]